MQCCAGGRPSGSGPQLVAPERRLRDRRAPRARVKRVAKANRHFTDLKTHKRKTAHRVDQNPPDVPPERPHDNVLSYSHSMSVGTDGMRPGALWCTCVYVMRQRARCFVSVGTHLVLMACGHSFQLSRLASCTRRPRTRHSVRGRYSLKAVPTG